MQRRARIAEIENVRLREDLDCALFLSGSHKNKVPDDVVKAMLEDEQNKNAQVTEQVASLRMNFRRMEQENAKLKDVITSMAGQAKVSCPFYLWNVVKRYETIIHCCVIEENDTK